MINNRPLTYVPSDDDQQPIPISPSQLLYGYRTDLVPEALQDDELCDPNFMDTSAVRTKLARNQRIINEFWSRWVSEYLVALRERDKNLRGSESKVKKGDVVLIHDSVPRVLWKMGIVWELFPGRDGIVRSVKLKTNNGFMTRPVIKCYPLEINSEETIDSPKRVVGRNVYLRAAALKARQMISNQLTI